MSVCGLYMCGLSLSLSLSVCVWSVCVCARCYWWHSWKTSSRTLIPLLTYSSRWVNAGPTHSTCRSMMITRHRNCQSTAAATTAVIVTDISCHWWPGSTTELSVCITTLDCTCLSCVLYELFCRFGSALSPLGQTLEIGAFPTMVRLCGTVCQLTCGHLTFRWTPINGDSKHSHSRLFMAHLLPSRKVVHYKCHYYYYYYAPAHNRRGH